MTYLNLISAILVIATYYLGKYVGKHSRDAEITTLTHKNSALATMLDFVQSESEHVAGLLGERVASAHDPIGVYGTSMIEIHADEQMRETARLRALLDEHRISPTPLKICAECGAFTGVNGPNTVSHAIGCKTGEGWIG